MIVADEKFLILAQREIETARESIRISTFKAEWSEKPPGRKLRHFFETLGKRKAEGLQVQFLMNWNIRKRYGPRANVLTLLKLANMGIEVRVLPDDRCCHAKIILIDDERAIIGSHNLSIVSTSQNFEISGLHTLAQDVCFAVAAYNAIWEASKTPPQIAGWRAKLPPLENPPTR